MNGKVTIYNEATGWTLIVKAAGGKFLGRFYLSGSHHSSPHQYARDVAAYHGPVESFDIEFAGKSPDYDREIALIAADPHFMS